MLRLIAWEDITLNGSSQYLVKNMIPAQDITVIWGKPKSGKTFLVLDVAIHVAAGIPYRGRDTTSGPVVYFTFEGAHMFPARVHAAREGLNLKDRNIPFYYSPDRRKFTKVGGAEELIQSIKTLPHAPVLVVLDTVNRSLDGSENSDEDMTHYTRCAEDICKEFNCAVIVVHHCGVSGDKPRGHTSLTGTCAAQMRVDRVSKAPVISGKAMMVSLAVEFMKDGPEGTVEYSWLQPVDIMAPDGTTVTSCYAVSAPEPNGREFSSMPDRAQKALSILQREISEIDDDHITVTKWKTLFVLSTKGKKVAAERHFYRAYNDLRDSGDVVADGTKVFLRKASE